MTTLDRPIPAAKTAARAGSAASSRSPTAGATGLLLAGLLMTACAGLPGNLKPGDSRAAVLQRMGAPTAEHPAPNGGRKLEYATGPYGKFTYMVVLDAQERLVSWENVLDEAHFNRILAGITAEQLRQTLGRPSRVWAVRYHDQTVWSYRYETSFCLLFHVGITPQGIVEDTSYGPDPACDRDRRGL